MNKKDELLCKILKCKELDLDFVINLYEKYSINFNEYIIRNIVNDDKQNINWLIYDILNIIVSKFKKKYEKRIYILNWYKDKYLDYEIYSNYFDSYIKFKNNEIQELFDNSEFSL